MKQILIATSNPGKFNQMIGFLNQLDFEFLNLKNFPEIIEEPEESGETFEENALIKAQFYFEKTKIPTIAEDSGILVDALPGELGVKTRRWGAGAKASDEEWITFFLDKMKEVPQSHRRANFISNIVFYNGNEIKIFKGECKGEITKSLEAEIKEGIPLSSCFRPEGYDRVYSALGLEEKMEVSHRGKAAKNLMEFLLTFQT